MDHSPLIIFQSARFPLRSPASLMPQVPSPLRLSFLGFNPLGGGYDGRGLIDAGADRTFSSLDSLGAMRLIRRHFALDARRNRFAADGSARHRLQLRRLDGAATAARAGAAGRAAARPHRARGPGAYVSPHGPRRLVRWSVPLPGHGGCRFRASAGCRATRCGIRSWPTPRTCISAKV